MKKALAVLVILLMASALVFASGGGQQQPAAGGGAAAAPAAPVKITVELFDRGTDGGKTQVDNNAWTQWIKEKVLKDLNIDVTFHPVPRWTENTDIINLMAAGSAPDLCYTYNGEMINSFRDQGGILDLAPYVDTLLPDMKALLGADPVFIGDDFIWRNLRAEDNKMYSIYCYRVALAMRNIFIRKDWLDKLGLPLPKTTEEFHQALIAFRDNASTLGVDTVVPFGQDFDARWGLASLVHPSMDPNMSERDRYVYNIGSRMIYAPGYKEGMRMMNQWYNEGLIFRDFPLMRVPDDFYNLIKSGVVGAIAQNWDLIYRSDYKILADLQANVPGANFVPVDCIQDANGVTTKDMMDKTGLHMYVPSFSRQPEAALKYLNWLSIPANYHFLQVGTEGVNHKLTNGVPELLARPPNDPWFMNSAANIDMTMPMNGIEMGSDELNARVLALSYAGVPAEEIVNAYALSIANARAPVVVQVPTTKDGPVGQTLMDKADALIAQAVTAPVANFDRVWDAGIQDWLASGGQEVMDERAAIAATIWQ